MSSVSWTKARPLPVECPFFDRSVTLICTGPEGCGFTTSTPGKREALGEFMHNKLAGNTFLVAWTGKYRTDIFAVTVADVERLLK